MGGKFPVLSGSESTGFGFVLLRLLVCLFSVNIHNKELFKLNKKHSKQNQGLNFGEKPLARGNEIRTDCVGLERQTDRQTEKRRQRQTETDRQADRETDRDSNLNSKTLFYKDYSLASVKTCLTTSPC